MTVVVVVSLVAVGVLAPYALGSVPRRSRARSRAANLRVESIRADGSPARTTPPGLATAVGRLPIWARRAWESGRERRSVELGLGDALEVIAAALRSGRSLGDSIGLAAQQAPPPLARDLTEVAARVARGAPLDASLEMWAEQRSIVAVTLAVAGLRLAAEVGGAQGEVLDDLAATVRERVAAGDELRAAATQARASAAVLAVAPVGFALFSGLVDSRTLRETVAQPLGLLCLLVGLALDIAGGVWMLRLSGRTT